jgi:hypothetical protein
LSYERHRYERTPGWVDHAWIPAALQDGLWRVGRAIDPDDGSICFSGDRFRHDPEVVDAEQWSTTRAGAEDALTDNGNREHHPEAYLNSRTVGDVFAPTLAT